MKRPPLETLIILSANLAVVLTCPKKLAHKLQGEEASLEDQQGKYEEPLSQALNLSKAAQKSLDNEKQTIFNLVCGNRENLADVFVHMIKILSPLSL